MYIIIIMENKQAVAVAVGVGAVGTALAYLGYSAYHGSKKESDKVNLYNDEEKDVQLEAALKEEENTKLAAKRKNSAWGKFWKKNPEDIENDE